MTPDPAPYGADLPRGLHWSGDYADALAALDAANAEVLALRAERDALRDVVEAVREACALSEDTREPLGDSIPYGHVTDAYHEGLEEMARNVLALLPAPAEGDG